MTNLEIPEMIRKAAESLGLGDEFEYFVENVAGVEMRTLKRYSKSKDSFEYFVFPAFAGIEPRMRFDWEISASVIEDDETFPDHMRNGIYFQLMQDLFEILSIVADNSVSKDLYKPVIPESVWV